MFFQLSGFTNFWLFLIEFAAAATVVLIAGSRLAVYGDKIADRSGLSHGWIGFILLASITSLPELMTGISSTALVGSVDLVLSDTIGSNAVNLVILALLFFVERKALLKLKIEEMITGYAGLILLGAVAAFLFVAPNAISPLMSTGFSLTLFLLYLLVVYITFKTGGLKEESAEEKQQNENNEREIGWKFALFSFLIIIAAIWMTRTAGLIAKTPASIGRFHFTLGQTFVGALLLSIATSLPELSVTFSAAKIGRVSMAVGNIFGSNIFNIFIIPISALFYHGVFWHDANPANMQLVIMTLILTGIVSTDLIYRTRMKTKGPSLLSSLAILVWIGGMVLLFFSGHGG